VTRRFVAGACLLALLASLPTAPVGAATKISVAALGIGAPGGGVFAGPSFVGEPSAAGSGWIAFRSQVTEGNTSQQIVVTNQVTGQRSTVASIGQSVSDAIGTVKQFLGRPTVNARGDVAFAAEITPPDNVKKDPLAPTPGGVFLWSQGTLSVVVAPGFDTGFGILDLTTPVNVIAGTSGSDIAERTPALNDNGDVAFVASTLDGTRGGGAIFLGRPGQDPTPVIKLDDPYEGGTFQILGPPALNNAGILAFHAFVDGPSPLDGIFKRDGAGALSLLIRDGTVPDKLPAPFEIDPLFEFGDVVALNDAGDVACTGGPVFDDSADANLGDLEGSPGVIVIKNGVAPLLVGYPGLQVDLLAGSDDQARISDLTLGAEEGFRTAPPSLTPDGKVIFFAQVNSGASQLIARADPDARTVRALVRLGGPGADSTPAGGNYLSASSAPAVDTAGNFVFSARIENADTSEALIWSPAAGAPEAIPIGDAVPDPGRGFYGGPAFFPPVMNDGGDVVFRSYVARGPGLGMFRYRQGKLDPIVRVHDAAPVDGDARFSNLIGEPSINSAGDIAFAATLAGRSGRGVFVASNGALRKIAFAGDGLAPEDPNRPGAFLRTIAANPSINDSGAVVFRGVLQYESRFGVLFPDERRNCVFLADPSGAVRVIASQGDDSGAGLPFFTFRDPTIRGDSVLFRAPLGDVIAQKTGLFLADPAGLRPVAIEGDDLGGMTLSTLQGKGLSDDAREVIFSAKVQFAGDTQGAIVRNSAAGFESVVQTGMFGPEGGRIRSLGRPSMNAAGEVALRVGFEPFSGGVAGIFVVDKGGRLQPFVRIGEGGAAGVEGRITSLNQNVSFNNSGRMAFLASIGGGQAGSAIFMAAPSPLRVPQLTFRRGPGTPPDQTPKPRDRINISAVLQPQDLPPPTPTGDDTPMARARRKLIAVTVADQKGTVWTATLPAKDVQLRGRTLRKKRGGKSESQIESLRVQFARKGTIRIAIRSKRIDLSSTAQGVRTFANDAVVLVPPFTVRIDAGEDGSSSVIPCSAKSRRFTCHGT
jgi:hypothetical protein